MLMMVKRNDTEGWK